MLVAPHRKLTYFIWIQALMKALWCSWCFAPRGIYMCVGRSAVCAPLMQVPGTNVVIPCVLLVAWRLPRDGTLSVAHVRQLILVHPK